MVTLNLTEDEANNLLRVVDNERASLEIDQREHDHDAHEDEIEHLERIASKLREAKA
jgi:DNA gyrase/topoisomerase IV subunit A